MTILPACISLQPKGLKRGPQEFDFQDLVSVWGLLELVEYPWDRNLNP